MQTIKAIHMKIMLAGSFCFAKEIIKVKAQLDNLGHTVLATEDLALYADAPDIKSSFEEELKQCLKYDSMRNGFKQVVAADAVLVCNYPISAHCILSLAICLLFLER